MNHEVRVTGVGAVTCHGAGADGLWRAMTAARVRPPDRVADPGARMELPLIGLVPDPDFTGDRAVRFAVAAAGEALRDARLDAEALAGARTAVVIGSCMGEPGPNERGRGRGAGSGERGRGGGAGSGAWVPPFRLATELAAALGIFGTVHDIGNACAAGAYAIGAAADLIRAGEADIVLAGGSDAYSRVALGCFNRLGAVDPERCRPFEADRAGTVFAEGAGILVLESAAHAAARGAGEGPRLGGSGWSCDAGHPTAPEENGEQIARAVREAMGTRGLGPGSGTGSGFASGPGPERIGAVVPHGTGTRLNDVLESAVLGRVLGEDVREVPLYSLKALIGHTGGASAALGAVAAVLMLRKGRVPGNVPLKERDAECRVRVAEGEAVELGRGVLVNACGFGGNNAVLLFEGAAGAPGPHPGPRGSRAGGAGSGARVPRSGGAGSAIHASRAGGAGSGGPG
ncbi:beta-ketoacyl synthase N-terminal-like domain-containing protein [Streptomyces sp. NPDC004609]|uniref:beta-ketoacyl synthase N-terminal-like domain-containing protein n=1 Tax=Streptomyces sp. NPDC004609 TaxID=3364704 RepID=UPI0036C44902